ncbi:hypothetical protein FX155_07050 [Acidaminococcus fermentans]|uniref:Uncharacterized protein n=1 Tax=Acidaminococcus fermentans TaxID=905 RepID=A0A6N7W2G2_ACIFE|nr:hypothetical protein [Acidaminococcus fermentans]MSS82348.1 hypothetical protein [Acidaminococcus fermentans]
MTVLRNEEHYQDPTAGTVIKTMEDRIRKIYDARDTAAMEEALRQAKAIFNEAGFSVQERIVLKNIRTGKIYR